MSVKLSKLIKRPKLQPLTDKALISRFQSEYKNIPFISSKLKNEAHDRTGKLTQSIDELITNRELIKQPQKIDNVWRNLLGKAIVYLKSEDDREAFHDDEDYGVEKLEIFYKTFREFEPLLYGAEEAHYRDHIAHMFSVFLAGEFLIRDTFGFDNIDVEDGDFPGDPRRNRITCAQKEAIWCIISLTHDLGIALERITDINPKARSMLRQFGITNMQDISYPSAYSPLDDLGIRLISSDLHPIGKRKNRFIHHIQSKYYMKYAEALERRDHGIISCLVLIKNLVFFLETDYAMDPYRPLKVQDAKQFLIRRTILRSVAAHSNENIYYLKIAQFPFLLTIFDEIHEWGRPRFGALFESEELTTDVNVAVKDLREKAIHYVVTFKPKDAGSLSNISKQQIELEIIKYFKRKVEKFRRVLRSAVSGKDRDIMLTLEVVSKVEDPEVVYRLVYKDPENIEMSKDGTPVSLEELSSIVDVYAQVIRSTLLIQS